jgi:hypothetical protein
MEGGMTDPRRQEELLQTSALSQEIRAAFVEAAQDERLWTEAREETHRFLRAREIEIPIGITITFLDQLRDGDWIKYLGPRGSSILSIYCPPERAWWAQCSKIVRACETKIVTINGEPKEVESNCYFVCEQFIWEEQLSLPQRPPWPPLPLPRR